MRTNSSIATSVGQTSTSSRFTINGIDDEDELMQRVTKAEGIDSPEDFERMQNYGFTSSLLDQDEEEQGGQQGGGQSGGGGGGGGGGAGGGMADMNEGKKKGKGAEGMVMYPNGDRSHPVLIAADDRRHRPYGIPKGSSAQYDQHGNMTYIKSGGEKEGDPQGVFMLAVDTEEEQKKGSGGSGAGAGTQAAGGGQQQKKMTERMVSLRHVEKEKQKRDLPNKKGPVQGAQTGDAGGGAGGAGGQQGGQQQQKEKHKHEGKSINNEVRVTKKYIEFYTGGSESGAQQQTAAGGGQQEQTEKLVGRYDKASNTWTIQEKGGSFKVTIDGSKILCMWKDNAHSMRVDDKHVHIRFAGNKIWVDDAGCWTSKEIVVKDDPCG